MSSIVMKRDKMINVTQTNMFGHNGQSVSMPRFIIYYQDNKFNYGEFTINDYKPMIEWLSMQWDGITLKEAVEYCQKNNPKIVVELNGSSSYIEIFYNDDIQVTLSKYKELKNNHSHLFNRSLIKDGSYIHHKTFNYGYIRGFINENNEYPCEFQGIMKNINASELEIING